MFVLLQSICFRMFCSKHAITFDTYLLNCRFHCVDIFYINFRSCETFTVTNSGAILLLIETLSNFRTMKCWFDPIPTNACFRLVQIQMFSISCLAFLRFTFYWYLHGSKKNIKNTHAVSTNQIADSFHFNDKVFKKRRKN